MANQWFRMYSEFATDPKVQMLSEAYQRRLMMLFCIRCNGDVTLHDDEIAFQLRVTSEEWAQTKAVFVSKNFITEDNQIVNWDKRQYASDSSKERVARYRERQRNADVTACNVTVTPPDTEQNRTEQKNTGVKRPDDVSENVWNDFIKHRKAKKSTVTETAILGFRREAGKAGIPLQMALEISIQRGWAGFEASWLKDKTIEKHNNIDPHSEFKKSIYGKSWSELTTEERKKIKTISEVA